MKDISIKVLLLGGLFIFQSTARSEVILEEVFIYKVSDKVFGLTDISRQKKELEVLNCLYPDSLLTRVFVGIIKIKDSHLMSEKIDMSKITDGIKSDFLLSVKLSKLSQYVETHNVYLNKNLKKAFYLASRKECKGIEIFKNSNTFTPSFRELLSTEIFLRKRFLNEKKRAAEKDDLKSAISSTKALIQTIEKQIESEVYWKDL